MCYKPVTSRQQEEGTLQMSSPGRFKPGLSCAAASCALMLILLSAETAAAPPASAVSKSKVSKAQMKTRDADETGASSEFGDMTDGKPIINRMEQAIAALEDYSFESDIFTYQKGKKPIRESGRFFWRKPNLVRLEVAAGSKKGAVVVVGKEGKVHGRLGGLLKVFTAQLNRNSHMLHAANGYSMIDCDLKSLVDTVQKQLESGATSRATVQPVKVGHTADKVVVVEILKKGEGKEAALADRIFVDANTNLPERWNVYRNGDIWSVTDWKNLKTNQGLKDDLFDIKR